jgi:Mrp family chromosome partitioning ATPase
VVAAVLWASFAQDLRSAEQAWALLGLRTLALVPKVRLPSPIDRAVVDMPGSAISESIRYLYTSIQGLLEKHPGCFRVLVSSAVPDEGKSTTARMLAREAALAGAKTLLLNLDLRRRRGTREQSEAPFGIQVDVEEDTGLHVLEVHSRSRRSFAFLHQQGFWDQVEELSCQYELMVIDSPPVLSVSDASTIARFTDSTIFIVRWAKTPIPAVVEALRQLRAINTKILGVVLTQVNARKHAMYSFGDSGVYRGKHKRYYLDDKVKP